MGSMGRVARLALAAGLLLLTACGRTMVAVPPAPPVVGAEEVGLASWYGHPYHGRRTASGEVYDMADLTAAHRTLPFGSRLLVTNREGGQAVEVRVNDRGPFVDGRILDLSWGAARLLGAVGPGVIPVRVRLVALPGDALPPQAPGPPGAFVLQVGAFTSRERALALREAIAADVAATAVVEPATGSGGVYRVRLGPFPSRAAAEAGARRLAALGYPVVVIPAALP
jgi:rare lipoprotein A